jgi:hypothetical protein
MDRRFLTVLGVSLLFALVISSVFYQMTARAGGSKRLNRRTCATSSWRPVPYRWASR